MSRVTADPTQSRSATQFPIGPSPGGLSTSGGALSESWPPVSVVMPIRNEERHLAAAVQRVLDQDYPGELEIIAAVGPSRDRTVEIAAEIGAREPRFRVVDNPTGRTPNALNLAVDAARFDVIVRVDGHGELTDGYLATAVRLLRRTGAANVGGVMDAQGDTSFERAVACAYTSRLGIGGAAFHLADSGEGEAETVFLGVFDKASLQEVGGFDESMHRAQDWELNYRLRRGGKRIWFSPALRVTYRPRSSFRALAAQFYETGKWRREVVRRHSDTVTLRYLAPPVAVLGILAGSAAGLLGLGTGRRLLVAGFAAPAGYAALVGVGGLVSPQPMPLAARLQLPFVLAVMHLAWGTGFLVGLRPEREGRSAT